MAAKQALAFVAGTFGSADGSPVPRLDIQLQAVQGRNRPRKTGERAEGIGCNTVASLARGNPVSDLSATCVQLPHPKSDVPHGTISFNISYREGKTRSFAVALSLALNPRQGLLMSSMRREASHTWDIRILGRSIAIPASRFVNGRSRIRPYFGSEDGQGGMLPLMLISLVLHWGAKAKDQHFARTTPQEQVLRKPVAPGRSWKVTVWPLSSWKTARWPSTVMVPDW